MIPQAQNADAADIVASLIQKGEIRESVSKADALTQSYPTDPVAWYLKAHAVKNAGDGAQAIICFNTALKYQPNFKKCCVELAELLEAGGQFDMAVKLYEHWLKIEQSESLNKPALILDPKKDKKACEWFHKGEKFHHQGDAKNAAKAFRKVLDVYPDMIAALTNLGIALFYQRQYAEAHKILMQCLHEKFDHIDALNTLGTLYRDTGHYAKAIAIYRKIKSINPDYLPAAINLGNAWYEMQRYDEAAKAHEETLRLDPKNVSALCNLTGIMGQFCRWDKAAPLVEKVKKSIAAGADSMEPFTVDTLFDAPELQYENACRFASKKLPNAKAYNVSQPLPAVARKDGKLRIGYLSFDLQEHVTVRLISELFELHDRSRFEIHAYSYGPDDHGPARARVRAAVDKFVDIRMMDDRSAADLIRDNGVDILIDLKGYTEGHRLGIMASRPAPVQMHYLGFPGTIGTNCIDYFIADKHSAPQGIDTYFSERLIRLPYSYQINDRKRALPSKPLSRAAYGLPETGFVFCGFNNSYKITSEVFAVWMRILKAVEGSVLWLYESHPESTVEMRKAAEQHGVNPERLIVSQKLPQPEHLARYAHADLFIDTFPVCGHTTASDALWCGVPVITKVGESFIARVAAGLLHAVELPELVVNDIAAYEALAISLASDPQRLKKLREHLTEGRMRFPLFDSAATTRALEAAYLYAARLHRDKTLPQAFSILPDTKIALD